MEWTPFAGLTALDENDDITIDGASFLITNPRTTDRLLRIGAVDHRHDEHLAIPNPQRAMTGAAIASAGTLAAAADFALTYTLVDQYGGETTAAQPLVLSTGTGVPDPQFQPIPEVINASGIQPAGSYFYAYTVTDGAGGETGLSQTSVATIDPGLGSASILVTNLDGELPANGGTGVNWRLWRSYEGADWHLVAQGSASSYLDQGFDPPDNPAEPPGENTTGATNTLVVTLPSVAEEPAMASGVAINIYLASDTSFAEPCFYEQIPGASAGATIVISDDSISAGHPPHVSTSIPGARQIYPDTDMRWALKSPVQTFAALPSGSQGDVRLTLDALFLYGFVGSAWVQLGGGGTWKAPVASAGALPFGLSNQDGDVRLTLDKRQLWSWVAGGGFVRPYIAAATGSGAVEGIGDIATDGSHIYWTWATDSSNGDSFVGRANLDGSGVQPYFLTVPGTSGITNIKGLAVDGGHIYWGNNPGGAFAGSVGRANLDGSGVQVQWLTGFNGIKALAVDSTYLYIGQGGTVSVAKGVARVHKDGTALVSLVDTSNEGPSVLGDVSSVAVDGTSLYWSQAPDGVICRANLDGSNPDFSFITVGPSGGGTDPMGLVVTADALYFASNTSVPGNGRIGRANKDGTGVNPDAALFPQEPNLAALALSTGTFLFAQYGASAIDALEMGAWVPVTASGASGGGGSGIAGIMVAGSGGAGEIGPETYIEFTGSGGTGVAVQSLGGGSARIVISASGTGGQGPQGPPGASGAPGPQGPPGSGTVGIAVAGSGGLGELVPETYVEFAGSGGTGVAVQNMGGGSARILISAPAASGGSSGGGISPSGVTLVTGQIDELMPQLGNTLRKVNPNSVYSVNASASINITTPDGSGQVTEPAVEYIPWGWNGHKYWALITGYTNGNDQTENPSLYHSDDGLNFTPQPGVAFPIVGPPGTGHNDDPEIVLGPDNKLHLFWVEDDWAAGRNAGTWKLQWCTYDGTTLTAPATILTGTNSVELPVGPVLLWDGASTQWVLYYTDASNYINNVNSPYVLKRRTCAGTSPNGTWSAAAVVNVTGITRSIWEPHIARRGEQLLMATTQCDVNTGGTNTKLYFGVSDDGGLTFTLNPTPILSPTAGGWDNGQVYRGDIVPLDDGSADICALWYSATNGGGAWHMGYTTITVNDPPSFPISGAGAGGGGSALAGGEQAVPIQFVGAGGASAVVSQSGGSAIVTISGGGGGGTGGGGSALVWQVPVFGSAGAWNNYDTIHAGATFSTLLCSLGVDGQVRLQGLVTASAAAANSSSFPGTDPTDIICILPANMWPASRHIFAQQCSDNTTGRAMMRVDVLPDGTVKVIQVVAGSFSGLSGSSGYLALDGIEYPVAH